jgi:orotate phosphoribosyltransferase
MGKIVYRSKKELSEESAKTAKILLKIKAVTLNPGKPFKFASGILSPVYIDCRLLMSYPKERRIIRDLYISNIKKVGNFDLIAGTATAGIPHAAFISEKMNIPMIYIRGKSKDHGKGNQIEGLISKNQKVAIIEDLISTAGSSVDSAKAIKAANAVATHVFAIITYGMKMSIKNLKANNLELVPLTTFDETIMVAEKMNLITSKEKSVIHSWIENPQEWAKKYGFE